MLDFCYNMYMENENYQLLLDKLKSYDSKIEELEKMVKDVTSLNRTLLNTNSSGSADSSQSAVERHKELENKLKEAL